MLSTNNTEVRVGPAAWDELGDELRAVRTEVFIHEQGVAPELEWDGEDAVSHHFVATTVEHPPRVVGTARLMRTGQIGRMAVLKDFRGMGIGRTLLDQAVEFALASGFARIFLHAQTHAREFYEKAGFRAADAGEFVEANIPHVEMEFVQSPRSGSSE